MFCGLSAQLPNAASITIPGVPENKVEDPCLPLSLKALNKEGRQRLGALIESGFRHTYTDHEPCLSLRVCIVQSDGRV